MQARREHQQIREVLDAQVNAKKQARENDDMANRAYMKRWVAQTEAEN